MADPQYVIVELRVDASDAQQGSADYAAALGKAQQAADALTSSAQKTQAAITSQGSAMTQAKAANDNLASGYQAANDNFQNFGKSLADHAIDFLNNINHLKLMALGAYAVSPAFRSFVSTEITAGLQLIGVNIGLVTSAMTEVVKLAAPALSFFAAVTIPIAAAVLAWQAFNYVLNQGSALLTQYGNAERSLFSSNVDADLTKLTAYQTDTISLQQVQYATDLGSRLTDAKATISSFFSIQFDVTNQALALQNIWVVIVETIAKAVNGLQSLVDLVSKIPAAVSSLNAIQSFSLATIPGIGPLIAMMQIAGAGPDQNVSQSQALALATQKLAAALGKKNVGTSGAPLGDTFAARFSGDISSLSAAPSTGNSNQTNAYDRRGQQIQDQIEQLQLEATGAGKTSEAYQELAVAHTLNVAAMRAGIPVTDQMQAQWKSLGDQIAAYTIQLNQAKVLQAETFASQTMFLSPANLAAANAAKQIDPTNWMAHLQDAGPQLAAFNSELTQTRDLSVSFADSFGQAMLQGKTMTEALQTALKSLESQLLNMITKQLVNQAFAGLVPSGVFGFLGLGGGASSTLAASNAAATGASASDVAFAFSAGGIVGAGGQRRYVHRAYFENAPRFDTGGMITDGGVPIIAHPGERVLNPQETRAYNSSGGQPINIVNNNDFRGSDPGTEARMRAYVDQSSKQTVAAAVQAVARTRSTHPKFLQGR